MIEKIRLKNQNPRVKILNKGVQRVYKGCPEAKSDGMRWPGGEDYRRGLEAFEVFEARFNTLVTRLRPWAADSKGFASCHRPLHVVERGKGGRVPRSKFFSIMSVFQTYFVGSAQNLVKLND